MICMARFGSMVSSFFSIVAISPPKLRYECSCAVLIFLVILAKGSDEFIFFCRYYEIPKDNRSDHDVNEDDPVPKGYAQGG
jgi:hypothetical protein